MQVIPALMETVQGAIRSILYNNQYINLGCQSIILCLHGKNFIIAIRLPEISLSTFFSFLNRMTVIGVDTVVGVVVGVGVVTGT